MISDVLVSILILVLSVILLGQTKNYNYLSAVFPRFVLVFLMILTVVLLIRAIVLFRKLKAERMVSKSRISSKDLFYICVVTALSFLWIYMMDWVLGFLLGSIVFGVLIFAILSGRSLKLGEFFLFSLGYIAIVFVFWYVLGKLLLVPLPRGLFF